MFSSAVLPCYGHQRSSCSAGRLRLKLRRRSLYFTRCAGFEHSAVKPIDGGPSYSDQVLTKLGAEHDVEVVCTKDGTVFDGDLDQYAVIAFYTSGDLCSPKSAQNTPPISPEGKQKLLDWVKAGGGFVGFHAANDSFHSRGTSQRKIRRSKTAIPTSR